MACPTCGHTFAMLTRSEEIVYRHCERCGTIRWEMADGWADTSVPKLVERCRQYRQEMLTTAEVEVWERLGLAECINISEERR